MFRFAKENVLRFLVGNKCDIKDKRKVTAEEGLALGRNNFIECLAKVYNIPFIETSAKEKINTEDLFNLTMQSFLNKLNSTGRKNDDLTRRNTLVIDVNKKEERDDGCCAK